jgi:RimJ/RimL family protein N-acetyltransferase
MEIRLLTAEDLHAYRALHRFALTESPHAFVETLANDEARPDEAVRAMLALGRTWGLVEGGRLLGGVVLEALPYDCLGHTRWLHAVYIHPYARGHGAADRLIEAAIAAAQKEGARTFALWVNAENIHARRLYERIGFKESGRIPKGIVVGGRYCDDVLMCRQAVP